MMARIMTSQKTDKNEIAVKFGAHFQWQDKSPESELCCLRK